MRARVRGSAARVPRMAYLVALVALINGFGWSLLTPPFEVPDENGHVAYVQYLAETGKLPVYRVAGPQYSGEERAVLAAVQLPGVAGLIRNRPPWFAEQFRSVYVAQPNLNDRVGLGSVGSATDNPPLYYALESVPYWASPSHSLLDRLVLMRMFSALLSAITVGLLFMFLREVLPRTPWTWLVGALVAALNPVFGQVSGGVNADDLLFLTSAAAFLLIARCFRRGLTLRRGVTLGVVTAAGLLAKPIFIGLIPGIALALGLLVLRRRELATLRAAAAAVAAAMVPLALYVLALKTVWTRPIVPGALTLNGPASPELSNLTEEVSFVWQLFLPRLPFMSAKAVLTGGAAPYPGQFPLRDLWLVGFIGKFGWLDYGFSPAVYDAAWTILRAVGVLFLVGMVTLRHGLRQRAGEIVIYLALGAGLLAVIGVADYRAQILGQPRFEQARYLMPLLSLYAGLVAVAVHGLGRRFGPVLGAALVVLALAHTIFSQLLTVARFYG